MTWPSHYFSPEELLSPDGLSQYHSGNLMLQFEAIRKLEQFRIKVGMPLFCNYGDMKYRGYRSPQENAKIGGAIFSRHVQGIAFDITCLAMDIKELFELAKEFRFNGIGYYPDNNFIHIDCRTILSHDQMIIWSKTK